MYPKQICRSLCRSEYRRTKKSLTVTELILVPQWSRAESGRVQGVDKQSYCVACEKTARHEVHQQKIL